MYLILYNIFTYQTEGGNFMPIATTQSDFRNHIKDYLDQVNDEGQTVMIARSNQRAAAVISQDQLNALLAAVSAKEDSLDYAIARDRLIKMHVLPDDPIVDPNEDYWNQFKKQDHKSWCIIFAHVNPLNVVCPI